MKQMIFTMSVNVNLIISKTIDIQLDIIITKKLITNNLTNYITKRNSTTNNQNVLDIKQDFSTKHYIQMCLEVLTIIDNNVYNKYD